MSRACHGHFFEKMSRVDIRAVVFWTLKTTNVTGTFSKIVTGTFCVSRALFRKMSRVAQKMSRGKKKHCVYMNIMSISVHLMCKYCAHMLMVSAYLCTCMHAHVWRSLLANILLFFFWWVEKFFKLKPGQRIAEARAALLPGDCSFTSHARFKVILIFEVALPVHPFSYVASAPARRREGWG